MTCSPWCQAGQQPAQRVCIWDLSTACISARDFSPHARKAPFAHPRVAFISRRLPNHCRCNNSNGGRRDRTRVENSSFSVQARLLVPCCRLVQFANTLLSTLLISIIAHYKWTISTRRYYQLASWRSSQRLVSQIHFQVHGLDWLGFFHFSVYYRTVFFNPEERTFVHNGTIFSVCSIATKLNYRFKGCFMECPLCLPQA